MAKAVIGFFDTRTRADEAAEDLTRSGFERREIKVVDEATESREQGEAPSFWDQIKDWLGTEDTAYYQEGTRRGGAVVTVNVSEDRVEDAATIIDRHGPADVEVEAQRWQQEGWAPPGREAASRESTEPAGEHTGERPGRRTPEAGETGEGKTEGEQRVPLPEEELHVGKRRVQRGGVRIYTRVTEQPVEEQVELTDEHVDVQRRSTDEPADDDAFKERTIETTETHEEPVVEKEARTKEELVIDKEEQRHTETVRDTARKMEADVEGGEDESGRRHAGGEEERRDYEIGRQLALDERYRGHDWQTVEPQARQLFEQRGQGDWSYHRDVIRRAFEQSRAA